MKNIVIVGSTGSIGTQTLAVIDEAPDSYRITALCCGTNVALLAHQIAKYHPAYAVIAREEDLPTLASLLGKTGTELLCGEEALCRVCALDEVDTVVMAMQGLGGLAPTLAAVSAGKRIALANKEIMVTGARFLYEKLKSTTAEILPVDSEHSAIWQCLRCGNKAQVDSLILTCSGGAFRDFTKEQLQSVTAAQALKNPNWSMGAKVTVDSATLMNKGLEVIEAMHLFNVPAERIEVLIHRESVVHSMVRYIDGSTIAQLSYPDMRLPIQLALAYPERAPRVIPPLDLAKTGALHFDYPDLERFPCLALAYSAAKAGRSAPAVLSAAGEVAVQAFLQNKIGFYDIYYCAKHALDVIPLQELTCLEELYAISNRATLVARQFINGAV